MDTSIVDHALKQKPSYRASPRDWLRSGGHAHQEAAFRFLRQLSLYTSHEGASLGRGWLLPFRGDFRRMRGDETTAALRWFVRHGDPNLRHVYIWLLSQAADRFRLLGISDYSNNSSPQIRKHVAKALRRLEAWSLLAEMAACHPEDAKIRWYATAPTMHRPFAERLNDYKLTVNESHAGDVATPSQMPFWALERAWERTPPKSIDLIRRMLRRIRHWVRWGMT